MKKLFRVELEMEVADATAATYELVDRRLRHCLSGVLDDGAELGKVQVLTLMIPILDRVEEPE